MSLLLSSKQKDELNKSLVGYFTSLGFTEVVEAFQKDAKISTPEPKFKDMLEKKWRAVQRLENRIDELSQANRELSDSLKNFGVEGKVVESDTLPEQNTKPRMLTGHRGPVISLCFHPRFNLLVSCSEDNTAKVWDADSGTIERTLSGHTDDVQWCEFSKDGALLATCSTDTTIRLWDFGKENDGTFESVKTLLGHDHTVSCVTFSKDGDFLYSASRDKTIKMWEVGSGHCKKTFDGHTDWVRVVKLSPDESQLASCGLDQTVCVWDLKTGNCLTTLRDHDHVVESIAWANAKADQNIIDNLLDDEDRKVAKAHQKNAVETGKSSSGMFLASVSRDRTVRIWMVFDGVCVKAIRGHDGWVRGVEFHPSGRYMLSCSDDKTVRVWDLVKYGRCKTILEPHSSFISCLAWNLHSPMMATGCVDNSLAIWDCS